MVDCNFCSTGMGEEPLGCDSSRTIDFEGGDEVTPIPYGEEEMWEAIGETASGHCHDCGTIVGEHHHPGCDMEECPSCGEQYFICPCVTPEKKEIWGGLDE